MWEDGQTTVLVSSEDSVYSCEIKFKVNADWEKI